MKELISAAERLVDEELGRATKGFGALHHSPHEAFAVILEEQHEALENISAVDRGIKEFWISVMRDDDEPMKNALEDIEREAMLAACELIQVSAMAKKARKGYSRKEKIDEPDQD